MISKKAVKVHIESALESLHEAQWQLDEAMGLIGDIENRIDVQGVQAHLKLIIEKAENLIYDKSDDDYETEESYQFVTEGKVKVLRKSNHF
jgi:hypothetical protein